MGIGNGPLNACQQHTFDVMVPPSGSALSSMDSSMYAASVVSLCASLSLQLLPCLCRGDGATQSRTQVHNTANGESIDLVSDMETFHALRSPTRHDVSTAS
jgi:hypothetical protein